MKTAIITGALGQDGSYLTEYLLDLGYVVVGISRRKSTDALSYGFLDHIKDNPNFILELGDITDPMFMTLVINKYKPDEFYNLAAQSHVGHSFSNPSMTFQADASSVVQILDLLRQHSPETRFYQASTSELFGGLKCPDFGYTEESPFHPRSPYGVAKLAAHWATINFREAYGLYTCCGILFNHESPRRGLDFVTRKITNAVANIKLGRQTHITLGNLDAYRDWGHAKDYVKAMHLMLQRSTPREFVIATGETHSIREVLEISFGVAGLGDYEKYLQVDERFMRPSEVPVLKGNPAKAEALLGWEKSYDFTSLITEMYNEDYFSLLVPHKDLR
jgi:GDPmannose 4,6-dehydratase